MRLSKVKLVGFKSFVDPTVLDLKDDLTAIVGPNGCGKSNIIDAIRWVMGESSAKNLRGEAMDDVIFNGSTGRKPVGLASVELVFDNTQGRLGGEYSRYAELSVKRQVTREGQSTYFINQTRCRRKDVTDLFLGTGLGARSYAVIEQGMVNRVIEAKPDEMRSFLEEAAGISFYKKRRHETELRIKHTQENLERLTDLSQEQIKLLAKLEKQAEAAKAYEAYTGEQHCLKIELFICRWRDMAKMLAKTSSQINQITVNIDKKRADYTDYQCQFEQARLVYQQQQKDTQAIEDGYHEVAQDIAKTEQQLTSYAQQSKQLKQDLLDAEQQLTESEAQQSSDTALAQDLATQRAALEPEVVSATTYLQTITTRVQAAETDYQTARDIWQTFQQRSLETHKATESAKAQLEHLEQEGVRCQRRITRLQQEAISLELEHMQQEVTEAETSYLEQEKKEAHWQEQVAQTELAVQHNVEQQQTLEHQLQELQTVWQRDNGRVASLEALQEAALGKDQTDLQDWLIKNGLETKARLVENLDIPSAWQVAVEAVLGDLIQALVVAPEDIPLSQLQTLTTSNIAFVMTTQNLAVEPTQCPLPTLASVIPADTSFQGLWQHIFVATDIEQALQAQPYLVSGQMVVTAEGTLVGVDWIRKPAPEKIADSTIAREQILQTLRPTQEQRQQEIRRLQADLQTQRDMHKAQRQTLADHKSAAAEVSQELRRAQKRVTTAQLKLEQAQQRDVTIQTELVEEQQSLQVRGEKMRTVRAELDKALAAMTAQADERSVLQQTEQNAHHTLKNLRTEVSQQQRKVHEMQLAQQKIQTQEQNLTMHKDRLRKQQEHAQQRLLKLTEMAHALVDPQATCEKKLSLLLEKQTKIKQQRHQVREQLADKAKHMRDLERQQQKCVQVENALKSDLEESKLTHQAQQIKQDTLLENLKELDAHPDTAEPRAAEADIMAELERIGEKIERLGPINMAAITEFTQESERRAYLDQQLADVQEALATLNAAIAKIDDETKTRFKATFDQVRDEFQTLFPKLFGGGCGALSLVGDDLLSAGVALMAQPPGKKNASIHLLSGGEKALTAISFIFAIFKLNPAPFCILDEVDAPLDDANVGRFCHLVKYMATTVQFIFISHNKLTMEIAKSLIGVTMREPGVSRLVSVDIAAAMA